MKKLLATVALAAVCFSTGPIMAWAEESESPAAEQSVEPEKATTPETSTGEQPDDEQSSGVDETPTDPEDPATDPKDPPKEDPKDPPKEDPKDPPEDPGDGEDPPDGCDRSDGCEPPPCENDCGPPPCEEDCGPPPCEVNCGPTPPPPPVHSPTPGGSATLHAPCDPWSADVLAIDAALREKVAVAYAKARAINAWPTVLVSNDRVTGLNYGDTSGADYVGKIPTLDGGDATHICVKPAESNQVMKYLTN